MMTLAGLAALLTACLLGGSEVPTCVQNEWQPKATVAGASTGQPVFDGASLGISLTAEAVIVWEEKGGQVLYEVQADERRPVASLTKLFAALVIREKLPLDKTVVIPAAVRQAQQRGADISLPVGEETVVRELLTAGLVASANDAMVAVAVAASGSEEEFAKQANDWLASRSFENTHLTNATGLSGGEQYSTAREVKSVLHQAYQDKELREILSQEKGQLKTRQGSVRRYKTTNKLIGTYLPVVAGKTGFTGEAGENLAILTENGKGEKIGAVVLGSRDRFQDMKSLIDWIWRHYKWE